MAEYTDLALDLAELCDRLNVHTSEAGDQFIADLLSVQPWSSEFFQIIFSIINRALALEQLLKGIITNPAVLSDATSHLAHIKGAFDKASLTATWTTRGRSLVSPEHSSPIRMLSPALPSGSRYPKLTPEEADELRALVNQLLSWLRRLQLSERDFIRESLIEGLEQFQFRLVHLEWFGWGYTIQSLRDVILAYLTLERGVDPQASPDAAAVLKRLSVLFRRVYQYGSAGKDATDTANWAIACYNFTIATAGPALGYVAGLLTHG
jgi:hypothetical protein